MSMENEGDALRELYDARFAGEKEKKNSMWKILCRYWFDDYVRKDDIVADVAAGYCEFINNINAKEKIAIDLNPDVARYADKDVKTIVSSISEITDRVPPHSIDVFFVSNFLEHLNSKDEIIKLFSDLKTLLRDRGRIMILQPNIKYVGGEYWDFIDHKMPLTEKALYELAEMNGMKVTKCVTKFLPYTTKSRLPKSDWLIALYLKMIPVSGWFFGKQTFMVMEK